jgi:hypothetical protein
MDIISGITAAITTLKTGFEIKKLAGNLDSEVQQSELRVEIRKLQESLIDTRDILLSAKDEILNNRESLREKDKQIKALEDLLKFKAKLVRKDGMYFESDERDNLIDEPFCSNCWDSDNKSIHLTCYDDYNECPKCKNTYSNKKDTRSVSRILSSKNRVSGKLHGF